MAAKLFGKLGQRVKSAKTNYTENLLRGSDSTYETCSSTNETIAPVITRCDGLY